MKNNTIQQQLYYGKQLLKEHHVESYALDSQVLLMNVLQCNKVHLFAHSDELISTEQLSLYHQYLNKRIHHMPVQYILNHCEFMSLDFYVDEKVLIPRPDTEILVEEALKLIPKDEAFRILEIGTGSGCISISIAKNRPHTRITAVDISTDALAVATQNAKQNQVDHQICFLQSNLYESLSGSNSPYHMIISNPPYIRNDVVDTLLDNVKNYEPHLALCGGEDGLYFYQEITKQSKKHLLPKGLLLFEIGYDQGKDVLTRVEENYYTNCKLVKDLAGHDRVITGSCRT